MQVATLFREATSLLDAGMEEGSHMKMAFQENISVKTEPNVDENYKTASGGDNEVLKHQSQQQAHNHSHHISNLHHNLDHSMALVPSMTNRFKDVPMMKYEMPDDPYSFVDDDHIMPPAQSPPMLHQVPKKRGRKKKLKTDDDISVHNSLGYQGIMNCLPNRVKNSNGIKIVKERKKHDRFNGMPEEEVSKRTLPDHLMQNLDIVIIGINPGMFAAYKGHHYAGPGNHFWKCLYLSGLTPEPMTADDDYKLLKIGIGFTNMVERATKGSADLTRKEIKEGSQILLEKLRKFKPKIAVFNGKLIFEVFSGKKDFSFGRQPEMVDGTDTHMWVMPSSSARCAQLPRAADKVPFYAALKKFRDYLNGIVTEIDEKEMVFSFSKLKNFFEPDIKEEADDGNCQYNRDNSIHSGDNVIVKKEDETPKKKRGRPKKIKMEGDGDQKTDELLAKQHDFEEKEGLPKKKRGRPKKVKTEENDAHSSPSAVMPPQTPNMSDLSNPPPSHCFSPPGQSPSMHHSFSVYHQSLYNNALSSRSPLGGSQSYHQSHGYNQSPQPPSFTHSDLSSEISAAISSEHNPESPTLGPPDFEPPGQMAEDGSNKSGTEEKEDECHYSSPQSKKSYQNYDDFSTDSDSGVRYQVPQKSSMPQDLTSKSLSGLESLVDQIPNITDGDPPHSVVSGESEPVGSQYSDDSAYMSDYAARSHYSPQYNHAAASTSVKPSNPYLLQQQQHTNFSVSSLANSSATPVNSFSVSSLTGTYPQAYHPNLMGPPPLSSEAPPYFGACRAGSIDSTTPVGPIAPNTTPIGAYPYAPQYHHPPPHHPSSYPNSTPVFYPAPSSSHNIHMPSPNYPYPSYSQPSYLPNHMFDRFKPDHRMDFGTF